MNSYARAISQMKESQANMQKLLQEKEERRLAYWANGGVERRKRK